MNRFLLITIMTIANVPSSDSSPEQSFPFDLPYECPDMPLSAAMQRAYRQHPTPQYRENELYSKFRYTELKGFDYHNGDGTVTRRDPSKVIKANGQYYVWYTYRNTPTPPRGAKHSTDTIPSADWDLSEIWYATSKDGFTWSEQGVAVTRPSKPDIGWRSVSTPDILEWKGKFYLYYQSFMEASGKRGDDCPVSVAWADSPDGPWTHSNEIVVPNGPEGSWDQFSIHDPYPLVYRGKIYLYYKSDFNGPPAFDRAQGLAIAESPLGPFKKHPLNPVLNSGHETTLFPFKEGIAAFSIRHGNEHSTIQYSPDGYSFEVASICSFMPYAAGPYVPDAFTDTGDGRGITWGLAHFTNLGEKGKEYSILNRFDCDLSRDSHDRYMKRTEEYLTPEFHYSLGLSSSQKKEALERSEADLTE